MAYKKQNFSDGLTLFASQLNHIEDGIVELENKMSESGGTGDDGFSPIAKVTQTNSGAVISITDVNGTTTATVTNGKNGSDGNDGYTPRKDIDYFDGKDGKDGKDGVSPIVTVSKKDKVTTIKITDAEGTKTAIINDGKDALQVFHTTEEQTEENWLFDFVQIKTNGRTINTGDWIVTPSGRVYVVSYADEGYGADALYNPTLEADDVSGGNAEDGFSPIATVEQTEAGAVISITDKNGTTEATITHGDNGDPGKSAYEYAQDGGYTGTEEEFAEKLAEKIPTMLPNPNALTINGTAYDGAKAVEIDTSAFVITITGNQEDGYTSDKTGAEIQAAYADGKRIVCSITNIDSFSNIPLVYRRNYRLAESTPVIKYVYHFRYTEDESYREVTISIAPTTSTINSINVNSGTYALKSELGSITAKPSDAVLYVHLTPIEGTEFSEDQVFGYEAAPDVTLGQAYQAVVDGKAVFVSTPEGYVCQFIAPVDECMLFGASITLGADVIHCAVTFGIDSVSVLFTLESSDLPTLQQLTINSYPYDGSEPMDYTDVINSMIDASVENMKLAKKAQGIFYIVGDSTTAGVWTGTSQEITEYFDGLTVAYKTNIAGVSGGSTLNINGLGAIPVKRNADTAVTTIYPAGSVILLTYSEGSWLTADYDANTKTTTGTSNKAATKLYLAGATSQSSSGATTYSNKNCFIGTDNCLYSNGKKTVTTDDSLKNPYAVTVGDATYDGSEAVDMTDAVNALIDARNAPETEQVLSDNLFDKSTAITGSIFYHSSSGPSLTTASECFYAYVPLRGAGTYCAFLNWINHGANYATRVPILKEDKSFLQNVTGTITDIDGSYGYLEFTVTESMIENGAALYAFDGSTTTLDSAMIVKDREYPSEYIPYGYIEVEVEGDTEANATNILSGKTAVFLGDSICAGTTTLADAAEYGYGWGGIIGEANGMTWKNYGRNGGTITPIESVDSARWVPTQVNLALAAHPSADYVIFEGGTNDADTLGASGLGTFSISGYASSDDSDFTGAFETLVLKILNAYPYAKVGYIVAPKMGAVNDFSSANNRRAFFDRAVEICEKWGIPVLDLWKCNPLNPKLTAHYDSSLTADEANTAGKFYTDGQHLTLAGYQRITPQIEAFMRSL